MSFKNIFILTTVCLIMGCSDFINGQKKKDEVLKFSNDRFACLNKMPDAFRNIVTDKSNPESIEETLVCLENSLTYFKKRTKGNVPDGYTVQDIRAFFGNYLGDQDRVSDEMAVQMMRIKKALFGGNEQVIAKTELQALIDFLVSIREEIQPLKPFWDIIIVKDNLKPSKQILGKSHQALKEGLTRLVLKTNLVHSEYSFSDFKSFMDQMEKFVKRSPKKTAAGFINWVSLMESVKIHLFGDQADMNSVTKWKEAVSQVLELHRIYSIYQYLYKGNDFYSPEAFSAGDEMVVAAISLLDKSWWMDRSGIPFDYTLKLMEQMQEHNLLPKNTTAQSVYQAYHTFVQNIFDREANNDEIKLTALTRKHISILKSEYRGFKAVQNFNDSMPEKFTYQDVLKSLDKNQSITVQTFSDSSDVFLALSWNDWQTHLRQQNPLVYLKSGELLLERNTKNSDKWSWVGLTRLNVMKFLNRMLMLGFGKKRTMDLSKEVLDENSLKEFYSKFWNLGVDLKAFDKRSGNSGKRTYFEADHFVYAGNGDGNVTLQESFELVNVIFSAGLGGLGKIQKDLSKSSCALSEKDTFDNNWLDETCFKKTLREKFGDYFKNLTGLSAWVATLNDKEWDAFYNELIGFSRVDANAVGRIESGDLRTMVVITHYIESMYIKFDTDGDDRLSVPELIVGSERFIPFFKDLFKLEPKGPFLRETQENLIDYVVARAFACMVITGQMPKVNACTPAFFKDAVHSKAYSDRTLILKTLNSFKSAIK